MNSDRRERELFEESFKRPSNFFQLPAPRQWEIDASLGLLDWEGRNLSEEDLVRFNAHYGAKKG